LIEMDCSVKLKNDNLAASAQADVLAAVSSMNLTLVVVCKKSEAILLVSEGMRVVLPTLKKNESWRVGVAHNAELVAAFDNALVAKEIETSSNIDINGVKRCVEFKNYDDNLLAITIQSEPLVADNLHEYMLARDNLFSTSRTISVSEMATTLAHELNTPIGTISNILRGVQMRLKKSDTSLEVINTALERALQQTQFSQNIISRIRDFTQSRRPKFIVLDMRQQLSEAIALIDWLISHNDCQVELQLTDEPLFINGDATMLQQVLINLIRNAVDAMHQQSVGRRNIIICTALNNDKVTVSIADTGRGFEDNKEKLFVPFATSKTSGMGVGLNICRSFIELHQGRLWLSPNEKEGCTCFVELPIASPEELQRRNSA